MNWVAVARSNGEEVLLNLSPDKDDVVEDAKLNSRIAVKRAGPEALALWANSIYQENRHKVRVMFGLPSIPYQESQPTVEDEPVLIGYLVTLKTKSVIFTSRPECFGKDQNVKVCPEVDVRSSAEMYERRYNGQLEPLMS